MVMRASKDRMGFQQDTGAHTVPSTAVEAEAGGSLRVLSLQACHDYAPKLCLTIKTTQSKQTNNINNHKLQARGQAEKHMV